MKKIFNKECEIHEITSTDSTNDAIKEMIVDNKIMILIAKSQKSGRGKGENKWASPEGNLYMSIGFLSDYENLSRIVFLIAVSIGRALTEYNIMYKWPNDLFIENKKVGGILIESDNRKIIIGIGINVENCTIVGSTCLNDYIKCDIKILPLRTINSFADHIIHITDFEYIKNLWEEKALFLNQYIEFNNNHEIISGKFLGINFDGSLILAMENNDIKSFHSGSICIT
jgi:BirA family biotin operon repressor/biotin-[acetyl-CoA-carboxylase] ligase